MERVVFFDIEFSIKEKQIKDIGAVKDRTEIFHSNSINDFCIFVSDVVFLCGHNIINHDVKYLSEYIDGFEEASLIDTLYISPLLFPKRPYHKLLKDEKLQVEELNNPVNDSKKAEELFYDELNEFISQPDEIKNIYYTLLAEKKEFKGFFEYVKSGLTKEADLASLIKRVFKGEICDETPLEDIINNSPIELAYALALIRSGDSTSVIPKWVIHTYPSICNVLRFLRGIVCEKHCEYCSKILNAKNALKRYFGFDEFRKYNGESLQENAVNAAIQEKSLLAIFPTGGGKSLTFQLPALIASESISALTVVISPLQSLMKDQVDNLIANGIETAVTLNGLLNPIERAEALSRLKSGSASILYISPEQLRSKTIESILLGRDIARVVIDEAHCFSAWGQDFRVDYLYIGDFIKEIGNKKGLKKPIPVSCFTATAKQKVISDICDYFNEKLGIRLEVFASNATRENLHYKVLFKENESEKYNTLRELISTKNCPTIIYVSRTHRTKELANRLTSDGFKALPYNGKMDPSEKVSNQEAFMRDEVKVIVATSAFGMGVDKSDVGMVIHYDISDSLENYVQEAGRAGRNPSLQADCYVLYNNNDLDKHFILLNQTKLSMSEIQEVWKAIKDLTKVRSRVCCSALEIARQAGWNDSVTQGSEIEVRVKTAIAALEEAGYVKRGKNSPKIYATSILAKSMIEASERIEKSYLFNEQQKQNARRIMSSLISSRSISLAGNDEAESRVDYLADILGIPKEDVVEAITLMRQEGLLQDHSDMSAYVCDTDTEKKSTTIFEKFIKLEEFIVSSFKPEGIYLNYKDLNKAAQAAHIANANIKNIRTILYFLTIKEYIKKSEKKDTVTVIVQPSLNKHKLIQLLQKRGRVCRFILKELYSMVEKKDGEKLYKPVTFSLIGLYNSYNKENNLGFDEEKISIADIENALLYLSKIGALRLEGGFLVLYNALEIQRLVLDNKIKYKNEDYRKMDEFYKMKIRQIHIVGEFANLMVKSYEAALTFVSDYFNIDFKQFILKYFSEEKAKLIERNITPGKYDQIFGALSENQLSIINDDSSKYVVVTAGPGSGKTRVLVHKLASLLLLEDVKHEQLLMLTFSRAAATEFKKRLMCLVGNAASFVEIKTFHSYCFDLIGQKGSITESEDVVRHATELIKNGEVEQSKIVKKVLVIDEAQDMDEDAFALVEALMNINEDMRVIAVGDDDQNIYEFRGSSSKYFSNFITKYNAIQYDLIDNYRSKQTIVNVSNVFVKKISNRMKSVDIVSTSCENGIVCINEFSSKNFEKALINDLLSNDYVGSSCILTSTNNEALQIVGALRKAGKRAIFIQSIEGFGLNNLLEIRIFLSYIDKNCSTPIISIDIWEKAISHLINICEKSACLGNVLRCLEDFRKTNRSMFRSDLDNFLFESSYEDFYEKDEGVITVSTIHKSKGREFDNVFMLLKDLDLKTAEKYRTLYVGMTRAKSRLNIYTNTSLFSSFANIQNVEYRKISTIYEEPKDLLISISHKDVYLGFFKDKKEKVLSILSGTPLHLKGTTLYYKNKANKLEPIAKFSKAFSEKYSSILSLGFYVVFAKVSFIVFWTDKEEEKEYPILLAELEFHKGLF